MAYYFFFFSFLQLEGNLHITLNINTTILKMLVFFLLTEKETFNEKSLNI